MSVWVDAGSAAAVAAFYGRTPDGGGRRTCGIAGAGQQAGADQDGPAP